MSSGNSTCDCDLGSIGVLATERPALGAHMDTEPDSWSRRRCWVVEHTETAARGEWARSMEITPTV